MKKNIIVTAALAAVLCGATSSVAGENAAVALITKTVQTVEKKSPPSDWAKAAIGDPLASGDQVQTGRQSLAVVKFSDNSLIRVRELSLLTVSGQKNTPGEMSKTVQLNGGGFGFDVRKQKQDERFRFTSPTSVASIRGTKGKLSRGQSNNDTLVVTEGLVNLRNNASGNEVDVPAGFIGFSNEDGTVSSRRATEQELADANDAALGLSNHEIRLEMKDSQGNRKELKIEYKK
jgi:hypothetical protein